MKYLSVLARGLERSVRLIINKSRLAADSSPARGIY